MNGRIQLYSDSSLLSITNAFKEADKKVGIIVNLAEDTSKFETKEKAHLKVVDINPDQRTRQTEATSDHLMTPGFASFRHTAEHPKAVEAQNPEPAQLDTPERAKAGPDVIKTLEAPKEGRKKKVPPSVLTQFKEPHLKEPSSGSTQESSSEEKKEKEGPQSPKGPP